MARPLNSTKPLYASPTVKAGRPAAAKLTIGCLGPRIDQSADQYLAQAVTLGQLIAEQRHIAAILTEEGANNALIRGVRQKAGAVIGFTASKSKQHYQQSISLPQLDTTIYTGQATLQQKLFLESLDILIIQAYDQDQIQLSQPLPRAIPVGVLISNRESARQVAYIAELAQASGSLITYSDNPRQLVTDLLKQAKATAKT